jgi:hypothetical protein
MQLTSAGTDNSGVGGGVPYNRQDSLLNNSPPITSFSSVFAFGAWFRAQASAGLANFGPVIGLYSATQSVSISATSGVLTLSVNGSSPVNLNGGVFTQGAWHFALARLGPALHFLDIYEMGTGKITHLTDTVPLTFSTTPTYMQIGPVALPGAGGFGAAISGGGQIAEVFVCDASPFNELSLATVSDDALLQLALSGPFSQQQATYSVCEYRSFKGDPFSGRAADIYFRSDKGWQPWVNGSTTASAPTSGIHPPIEATFVKPRQNRIIMPV